MRINSPLTCVGRWQMKFGQVDSLARGYFVEVRRLHPCLRFWISIVKDPLSAGQIADMAAGIQDTASNFSHVPPAIDILKKKIAPAIISIPVPRLGEDAR